MESKKVDDRLLTAIRGIVGDDGAIARETELRVYERDGNTLERAVPQIGTLDLDLLDWGRAVTILTMARLFPQVDLGRGLKSGQNAGDKELNRNR